MHILNRVRSWQYPTSKCIVTSDHQRRYIGPNGSFRSRGAMLCMLLLLETCLLGEVHWGSAYLLRNIASDARVPEASLATPGPATSYPQRHQSKLLCGHSISCCSIHCILRIQPQGHIRPVAQQLLPEFSGVLAALFWIPPAAQLRGPAPSIQ